MELNSSSFKKLVWFGILVVLTVLNIVFGSLLGEFMHRAVFVALIVVASLSVILLLLRGHSIGSTPSDKLTRVRDAIEEEYKDQ